MGSHFIFVKAADEPWWQGKVRQAIVRKTVIGGHGGVIGHIRREQDQLKATVKRQALEIAKHGTVLLDVLTQREAREAAKLRECIKDQWHGEAAGIGKDGVNR